MARKKTDLQKSIDELIDILQNDPPQHGFICLLDDNNEDSSRIETYMDRESMISVVAGLVDYLKRIDYGMYMKTVKMINTGFNNDNLYKLN